MTSSRLCRLALVVSAIGLAAGARAEAPRNGHLQHLAPHRAHPAPVSHLADTGPMPGAAAGLARVYGGTPTDVLTYHYDNNRTGWNPTETDLTPASVGSANFGLLTTLAVDGNVLAQPLLVSGFKLRNGTIHDVLIVATGHNTLYAFDAQTYAILWQVSLGTSQSSNDVGCSDVVPEYGISSTPVIVRTSVSNATVFVVAATEPSAYSFHTYLHAINLSTGADERPPVEISPSATLSDGSTLTFDSQNQWSRAGLAYNNGSIYVSIGSHCDANGGAISGWLLRYGTGLVLGSTFHTVETPGGLELASIWMTGFAPAIDHAGNVFVSTGNGDFTKGAKDWGESVLRLPANLVGVSTQFTPSNYASLNNGDVDLGSGGVMLLPAVSGQTVPPLAVAMGKSSLLYLLNQTALGGERPNDTGALQIQYVSGNGLWGGPAYYNGPAGPTVFTQVDNSVLRAFSVAITGTPALTQTMTGTTNAGYGGSIPVVSSNGATAGTGVVWLVRRSNPMELEAYDAGALGAPLFTGSAGSWYNGNSNSFVAPVVANGRVYAPAYQTVKVFGLQ